MELIVNKKFQAEQHATLHAVRFVYILGLAAWHVSDSSFPVELCSIRIIRFANKAVTEVMHRGKYSRTHYRKMWRVDSTLPSDA